MQNRFGLAPMTNHQSGEDGTATEDEIHWLKMRAEGNYGMVMSCAAHVSAEGQGFPRQLGVFSDDHSAGLRKISAALGSTFSVIQLHHGGIRSPKKLIGQDPVGPSAHAETGARAMTTEEVQQVVSDFITSAVRVEQAGFDGVEIHGAHGYLLAQFMSEELNLREDQYGGSYENRTRIVREIIDGICEACSENFSVGLRLSAEGNGMTLEHVTRFCQELLNEATIDYLDISLWDSFKEPAEEGYQGRSLLSYFTELRRGKVKLGVAGKIQTPQDAEQIISEGVDFVLLGKYGIFHHDYPKLYAENPRFEIASIPVTADYLRTQGVSENFITYLSKWDGLMSKEE